ncbi:MAG: FHA domain-containing protein, partial [Chloroflexota bacterium]
LDRFTWDISAYAESGRHILKVEATDSLGLTGASLDTPVDVTVVRPVRTPLKILSDYRYVIVSVVVGIAGVILIGTLLSGRVRLRSRRARRAERARFTDPVTQPVSIAATEPPTGPKKTPRRPRPLRGPTDAPAWLARLAPDGQAAPGSPILLLGPEVKLGTNPVQADTVLDEPALSPLHALIRQDEAGFRIFDQGSVAGTWVNYEIVTREGYPLKHGDRVHLGNLIYRFELKNPPPTPEPTLTSASP